MEKGDLVYDVNGNEYEFEHSFDGGFIVYRMYDEVDEYGPFTDDRPVILDKVFSEPPTQRYHKEIESLRRERDVLEKALHDKQAETRRTLEEYSAAIAKLSRVDVLRTIEACLDGEITHIVKDPRWDSCEIIEPSTDKFRNDRYDHYDTPFKLLTLYGRTNGDLEWKINEFSDGSGSKYWAYPCTSLEMAQDMVRKRFIEKMSEEEPTRRNIGTAAKLGIEVPDEYRQAVEAKERANAENAVKEALKKLEEAQAELDAMGEDE